MTLIKSLVTATRQCTIIDLSLSFASLSRVGVEQALELFQACEDTTAMEECEVAIGGMKT